MEERHYELIDSKYPNLKRIVATKDLPQHNIYIGDEGGLVESYDNLQGEAWIDTECTVSENAVVKDNAFVGNNSKIGDNAVVKDNARVTDFSNVRGSAIISENARVTSFSVVYENAKIRGNAFISNNSSIRTNADISGDAVVLSSNVFDNARVSDHATVRGSSVSGNASVSGRATVIKSLIENNSNVTDRATVHSSTLADNASVSEHAVVDEAVLENDACVSERGVVKFVRIGKNALIKNPGDIIILSRVLYSFKTTDGVLYVNSFGNPDAVQSHNKDDISEFEYFTTVNPCNTNRFKMIAERPIEYTGEEMLSKLTNNNGAQQKLYRIKASETFKCANKIIEKGTIGGWVANIDNVKDTCWVADEAMLHENCILEGNVALCDNAIMHTHTQNGKCSVGGYGVIKGNARILGDVDLIGVLDISDSSTIERMNTRKHEHAPNVDGCVSGKITVIQGASLSLGYRPEVVHPKTMSALSGELSIVGKSRLMCVNFSGRLAIPNGTNVWESDIHGNISLHTCTHIEYAKLKGNIEAAESLHIMPCDKQSLDSKGVEVRIPATIDGCVSFTTPFRIHDLCVINSDNDFCSFNGFGSRRSTLRAYKKIHNIICVETGCFDGDIKMFKHAVERTHENNKRFRDEYMAIIPLIKLKINGNAR